MRVRCIKEGHLQLLAAPRRCCLQDDALQGAREHTFLIIWSAGCHIRQHTLDDLLPSAASAVAKRQRSNASPSFAGLLYILPSQTDA